MRDDLTQLFESASRRSIVIHDADGRPLVETKLLHAAAVAAVGALLLPRLTAAVAVGALLTGVEVTLGDEPEATAL